MTRRPRRPEADGDAGAAARAAPPRDVARIVDVAVRRRATMDLGWTDALRLVDDAADGAPGLVVDAYAHVARVEVYGPAWTPHLAAVAAAVVAARPSITVCTGLVRGARGKAQVVPLIGSAPVGHVVMEDGARYFVHAADPDAAGTGLFVDHREGRRRVRAHASGRAVLNLFAHAGGFGVAAAQGGASRVDHVDAARKCAPWAALNLALNGVDPRGHRFLVDDALKVLARAAKKRGGYGVVVCDPPTTAVRPDGTRFVVGDDLPGLARDAVRALDDGGALVLSTNDRSLPAARVVDIARAAASAEGRAVRVLEELPLGDDLPTRADAQLRPMRGAFLILA